MKMARHIRQNVWGNWNGYIGRLKVIEFGTDEWFAKNWLATGDTKSPTREDGPIVLRDFTKEWRKD